MLHLQTRRLAFSFAANHLLLPFFFNFAVPRLAYYVPSLGIGDCFPLILEQDFALFRSGCIHRVDICRLVCQLNISETGEIFSSICLHNNNNIYFRNKIFFPELSSKWRLEFPVIPMFSNAVKRIDVVCIYNMIRECILVL